MKQNLVTACTKWYNTKPVRLVWKRRKLANYFKFCLLKASVFKNSSRKKCTKRYNTDLIRVKGYPVQYIEKFSEISLYSIRGYPVQYIPMYLDNQCCDWSLYWFNPNQICIVPFDTLFSRTVFKHWCLKQKKFVITCYGSQIFLWIFFNFIRNSIKCHFQCKNSKHHIFEEKKRVQIVPSGTI